MLESRAFLVEPASCESRGLSSVLVRAERRAALTGSRVDAGIPMTATRAKETPRCGGHLPYCLRSDGASWGSRAGSAT